MQASLSWYRRTLWPVIVPNLLIRRLYTDKKLRSLALVMGLFLSTAFHLLYEFHWEVPYNKYGTVGLGVSAGTSPYIFSVLPTIFKSKLLATGRESYWWPGVVVEEGHNLPKKLTGNESKSLSGSPTYEHRVYKHLIIPFGKTGQ